MSFQKHRDFLRALSGSGERQCSPPSEESLNGSSDPLANLDFEGPNTKWLRAQTEALKRIKGE